MLRSLHVLIGLSVLTVMPAQAYAYPIVGIGTDSCGLWTSENEAAANGDARQSFARAAHAAWVQGFLSGASSARPDLSVGLHEIGVEGIKGWIDAYCASNAKDTIARAAEALMVEAAGESSGRH